MNPNEMNVVKVSSTNRVKYLTSWAHAWQNKKMLNILCAFVIGNNNANIYQQNIFECSLERITHSHLSAGLHSRQDKEKQA